MPDATRSRPAADRNLLFGILALQMDFIDREALIAAMHAWVLDKEKPLGRILSDQGKLTADRLQLIEALVAEHLKAHDDDPQQSLAALSSVSSVRQELACIEDPDVQTTLSIVVSAHTADPEATRLNGPRRDDGSAALRYRILRPHAKGGLGEVFVAEDQELHRSVALKEIQASMPTTWSCAAASSWKPRLPAAWSIPASCRCTASANTATAGRSMPSASSRGTT